MKCSLQIFYMIAKPTVLIFDINFGKINIVLSYSSSKTMYNLVFLHQNSLIFINSHFTKMPRL